MKFDINLCLSAKLFQVRELGQCSCHNWWLHAWFIVDEWTTEQKSLIRYGFVFSYWFTDLWISAASGRLFIISNP